MSTQGGTTEGTQKLVQRAEKERVRRVLDWGCDRDDIADVVGIASQAIWHEEKGELSQITEPPFMPDIFKYKVLNVDFVYTLLKRYLYQCFTFVAYMSRKEIKNIQQGNKIDLPIDVIENLGQVAELPDDISDIPDEYINLLPASGIGPYIQSFYDPGDDKLVFGENLPEYGIKAGKLPIHNTGIEEFEQKNGRVSGKITLTATENEKLNQRFDDSDSIVLRIHGLDTNKKESVWVSVFTKENYENRFSSRETETEEIHNETVERTVSHDNFADSV